MTPDTQRRRPSGGTFVDRWNAHGAKVAGRVGEQRHFDIWKYLGYYISVVYTPPVVQLLQHVKWREGEMTVECKAKRAVHIAIRFSSGAQRFDEYRQRSVFSYQQDCCRSTTNTILHQ